MKPKVEQWIFFLEWTPTHKFFGSNNCSEKNISLWSQLWTWKLYFKAASVFLAWFQISFVSLSRDPHFWTTHRLGLNFFGVGWDHTKRCLWFCLNVVFKDVSVFCYYFINYLIYWYFDFLLCKAWALFHIIYWSILYGHC